MADSGSLARTLRKVGVRTIASLGMLSAMLLSACSSTPSSGPPLAQNQVFTWPYAGQASKVAYGEMLDPASIQYLEDLGTVNMLFVGLLSLDSNLAVQPDAAAAMPEIDGTGTVYTFHLKPNLKFSDGKPITAADFAYSIDRSLDPRLCTPTAYGALDSAADFDGQTYGNADDPNASPCGNVASGYINHILGGDAKVNMKPSPTAQVPSLISNQDDPTKGLSVIDPLTLRIRLDKPTSFFLQAMTYPTSYALEKSFIESYPGGKWVDNLDKGGCSGPFKVQTYGDNSASLTMVPNDGWVGAFGQAISLQKVVRPVISSSDDAYTNYQKGQYDVVTVPAARYGTAQGQGDFHQRVTLSTNYFGLNSKIAPFDNLQVRQAFALALNKQILVDSVTNGGAIPSNHFVPAGMFGYDQSLVNPAPDLTPAVTGNQDAANNLLTAARGTCPPTLSPKDTAHDYCAYITKTNPLPIQIMFRHGKQTDQLYASAAANQWSGALGLNVKATEIDRHTFTKNAILSNPKAPNTFQMWVIGWIADYADPQDFLTNIFRSDASYNTFGVNDPSLDAMMDQADHSLDQNQRLQLYNQAEQRILDSVAVIPFQQNKLFWRQRSWVSGFHFNSINQVNDTIWPTIKIYQH